MREVLVTLALTPTRIGIPSRIWRARFQQAGPFIEAFRASRSRAAEIVLRFPAANFARGQQKSAPPDLKALACEG